MTRRPTISHPSTFAARPKQALEISRRVRNARRSAFATITQTARHNHREARGLNFRAEPKPAPAWAKPPAESVLENLETTFATHWRRQSPERLSLRDRLCKDLLLATRTPRDIERVSAIRNCCRAWIIVRTPAGPRLQTNRCRERLCPLCQSVRQLKYSSHYERVMQTWTAPKHIVLTVVAQDRAVGDTISFLYKCFRRLRQHSFWRESVGEGYTTVEIKRKSGSPYWHVHLHIVCNASLIPKQWLHDRWEEITEGSWSTSINACTSDTAFYVAKYVGKPVSGNLDPEEMWAMSDEIKGRRLAQGFGGAPPLNEWENPDGEATEYIGTLEDVLNAAQAGDDNALRIIGQLEEHYGQVPGKRQSQPQNTDPHQLTLGEESLE